MLGGGDARIHSRKPIVQRVDESCGGVDGRDAVRAEHGDESMGERSGPRSDVEGALARPQAELVCEPLGERFGVATHELLVRLGRDLEAHGGEGSPRAARAKWAQRAERPGRHPS